MIDELILADKYRLLAPVGAGGTAEVFLAEHLILQNKWAVKRIDEHHPMIEINLRESSILKGLSHPMLPRITDIIRQEGYLYIVMDYLQGENMRDRMLRMGRFSVCEVLEIGTQLADVLSYLHSQKPPIIHRDIKPGNLLLDAEGRIHLIDFGSARGYALEKTDDTVYMGTKGYAAPEQYGLSQSDARTDLYSMGITLLAFLTGISPTDCEPAVMIEKARTLKAPRGLLQLLRQCVQVMPSARPDNAFVVLQQFQYIAWRKTKNQPAVDYRRSASHVPFASSNRHQPMGENPDDIRMLRQAKGEVAAVEQEDWVLTNTAKFFFMNLPRLVLFGLLGLLVFYFVMRGLGWDVWPAFGWKVTQQFHNILRLLKDIW